jgi:hypothetical protein
MNVPVGVGALIFGWFVIPKVKEVLAGSRIDFLGVVISAVGLFCLVLGLIQANEWGWTSARVLALFAVAIASYPLFMWGELRTPSPMFDFRLLRIRSFTAANTAMTFIGGAMGGGMFLLVIFLVTVLGYSELQAALAITPMALTAFALGPIIGRLVDKIGPRFLAAIGAACFGTGLLLLAGIDAQSSAWDATWRVIIIGVGMGFTFPTLTSAAMGSLVGSGQHPAPDRLLDRRSRAGGHLHGADDGEHRERRAGCPAVREHAERDTLPRSGRHRRSAPAGGDAGAHRDRQAPGGAAAAGRTSGARLKRTGAGGSTSADEAERHLQGQHREVVLVALLRRRAHGLPRHRPGTPDGTPHRRASGTPRAHAAGPHRGPP